VHTLPVTAQDDDGALIISVPAGQIITNIGGVPSAAVSGEGTNTVTIDSGTVDTDSTLETLNVTGDIVCQTLTAIAFSATATQTQAVPVTGTANLTCPVIGTGIADSMTLTVELSSAGATITTLETNPVGSNVSNADIKVHVEDESGTDLAGVEVLAVATTGVIETGAGCTGLPCTGAGGAGLTSTAASSTSGGISVSSSGVCSQTTDSNDTDLLREEVNTDTNGNAIFVYCASSGSTLGPTTITFIAVADAAGEPDIFGTVSFTIVGPPASVTLTAAPTSLVCGEKSTINGTVRDAIGQNVSNGTPVSLVTNNGGSIAATGSSGALATAAPTTAGGAFQAFLLTSTQNTGPYEVVAQVTGASGAQIFAQVTVTCGGAAATTSPQITSPNTGTGIRAPNTGDAGLVADGSSSALFAVAGLVAFVIAGLSTVKFARR
jgi:hypothetical protein